MGSVTVASLIEAVLGVAVAGEDDDLVAAILEADGGVYNEPFSATDTQVWVEKHDGALGLILVCHDGAVGALKISRSELLWLAPACLWRLGSWSTTRERMGPVVMSPNNVRMQLDMIAIMAKPTTKPCVRKRRLEM